MQPVSREFTPELAKKVETLRSWVVKMVSENGVCGLSQDHETPLVTDPPICDTRKALLE